MSLKAPTGLLSDEVIVLPAEAVEKSSGFSFDIGSTIGKLIYRSNKEYKDGKPIKKLDDPSKGQVHYAMFPRDDHEGMVKYIKENADLTKNEDGVILVKSSGVGGQTYKSNIETRLNCKVQIITEADCFVGSLLAMEKTHTKDDLFIPPSTKSSAAMQDFQKQLQESVEKAKSNTALDMDSKLGKDIVEDRPRLLVMAGSGSGIFQIDKDGTFSFSDMTYSGGRFLYGLASFLTGENDFGKLAKMAEAGTGQSCGTWTSDLVPKKKEGEEENMYNAGLMEMLIVPFGKGVTTTLEGAKKEDLVHNVFDVVAREHVATILNSCRVSGATEVFLCGNVFNTEIMRDLTIHHKMVLESYIAMKSSPEFHFVKNGGCMGALGAFLHKDKMTTK